MRVTMYNLEDDMGLNNKWQVAATYANNISWCLGVLDQQYCNNQTSRRNSQQCRKMNLVQYFYNQKLAEFSLNHSRVKSIHNKLRRLLISRQIRLIKLTLKSNIQLYSYSVVETKCSRYYCNDNSQEWFLYLISLEKLALVRKY